MCKFKVVLIFICVLAFTGCSQQEEPTATPHASPIATQKKTPGDEEVKELINSFLEAYNTRNTEKIYGLLSVDVKSVYSLEDVEESFGDFGLNIKEYNRAGDRVVVNASVNKLSGWRREGPNEWAIISFRISYNDSRPKIDSVSSLQRIERIGEFVNLYHPTPLPMGGIYNGFTEAYNERNATEVYSYFSEEVKENHSLEDVRNEMEFAREHDIKLSFNYSEFPLELLATGKRTMYMPTTMKFDGNETNCSIECAFYGKYVTTEELENSSLSKALRHTTKIDSWIFDEVEKCYSSKE